MPTALAINNTRALIPNIVITNSGSQRFDVYEGPFTKNDQLTASPFSDAFLFISNVTLSVANKLLTAYDSQGAENRRSLPEIEEREMVLYGRGHVDKLYMEWLEEMAKRGGIERRGSENLTLGYVTQDVSFSFLFVVIILNHLVLSWCWG